MTNLAHGTLVEIAKTTVLNASVACRVLGCAASFAEFPTSAFTTEAGASTKAFGGLKWALCVDLRASLPEFGLPGVALATRAADSTRESWSAFSVSRGKADYHVAHSIEAVDMWPVPWFEPAPRAWLGRFLL